MKIRTQHFGNDMHVLLPSFCNEVVLEAFVSDNENPSSLVPSEIIEEEIIPDPNKAHELSYSDSVLNELSNQSHQIFEVNDISLSTIKMPIAIKKRGRPKGQDLTVIGLPKKKKRNTVAFAKQSHHEKQNVILNFFVKDRSIVKDIINGKFLENLDLKTIPEEISYAVLDEAVDIHMIR